MDGAKIDGAGEKGAGTRIAGGAAGEKAAAGARMRAAQVTAPGVVAMAVRPRPDPGPGQVRVRIAGCGVCASNLEPWAGPEWMTFPTEPGGLGHEGWGFVEARGAGVAGLDPGTPVAFLGAASYASHEVVAADLCLPLPPALAGRPFPGEALGCAMNIFRRSGVAEGDRVAIVGIGFLGACLARLAAGAGAEVIAISRRGESLRLAARMGARHALPFDPDRAHCRVADLTAGRMTDVVIECVGRQGALDLASSLVATGGRLVIAGYHQDGPRQVDMQSWNWRGIDVINAHERCDGVRMRGMAEAAEAVAEGRLDLDLLLTHRFPLDRLDAALDATRDKPEGFVKAWVACGG